VRPPTPGDRNLSPYFWPERGMIAQLITLYAVPVILTFRSIQKMSLPRTPSRIWDLHRSTHIMYSIKLSMEGKVNHTDTQGPVPSQRNSAAKVSSKAQAQGLSWSFWLLTALRGTTELDTYTRSGPATPTKEDRRPPGADLELEERKTRRGTQIALDLKCSCSHFCF
jgi:hypothetical protein